MSWVLVGQVWRHIRASYWFIPSVMVVGAILLSFAATEVDRMISSEWLDRFGALFHSRPEGARAVLSVIASSMITVAGVTFSTTMVSVSFAAGQFGPRLIGNFMRDRGNQITLGVFIATFVYCLMVLRSVRSAQLGEGTTGLTEFVPHVSTLIALVLALSCVCVLIYFIHHVPETINVGRITSNVGQQLNRDVMQLFPEKSRSDDSESDRRDRELTVSNWQSAAPLRSTCDGFIQAVDLDALMKCAARHDLVLRLGYRPGDFANVGDAILHAHPSSECSPEILEELRPHFAFGRERTPAQNCEFLADQLIEILARALSPGVNDPYTAMNCIRWLGSALITMAERDPAPADRLDDQGRVRVVIHPITLERFARNVFERSRQYISSDRNACLEMIGITAAAAARASDQPRRRFLLECGRELVAAAQQNLPLEIDRLEVSRRFAIVERYANDPDARARLREAHDWIGGSG